MADNDTQWLTVEQVATMLGVSTRQAHRYGEGPSARLRTKRAGRRILFNRADVEALAVELGIAHQPPPAPKPPRVEIVQQQTQNELLGYLRERDEELRHYQAKLESLLVELGRLQAEVGQRLLP